MAALDLCATNRSRAEERRLRRQSASYLLRIYEADPLLCTFGAPMRIRSFLTEPTVIREILGHLESSGGEAARAPPRLELEPQAPAQAKTPELSQAPGRGVPSRAVL